MFRVICNILTVIGAICMVVNIVRGTVYFGVIGGTIIAIVSLAGAIFGFVVYHVINWIVKLIQKI